MLYLLDWSILTKNPSFNLDIRILVSFCMQMWIGFSKNSQVSRLQRARLPKFPIQTLLKTAACCCSLAVYHFHFSSKGRFSKISLVRFTILFQKSEYPQNGSYTYPHQYCNISKKWRTKLRLYSKVKIKRDKRTLLAKLI